MTPNTIRLTCQAIGITSNTISLCRLLFYSTRSPYAIYKANVDGTGVAKIVSSEYCDLSWYIPLAIDYSTNNICWGVYGKWNSLSPDCVWHKGGLYLEQCMPTLDKPLPSLSTAVPTDNVINARYCNNCPIM